MDDDNFQLPEDDLDFTADLITLTDEEGEEHTFELVDTLERDGVSYVALITVSEEPEELLQEDGSLVIMKVIEEDSEEILELIEDDDEFEIISEIFMERLSDLYEFDEDDEDESEDNE